MIIRIDVASRAWSGLRWTMAAPTARGFCAVWCTRQVKQPVSISRKQSPELSAIETGIPLEAVKYEVSKVQLSGHSDVSIKHYIFDKFSADLYAIRSGKRTPVWGPRG
jgi:hypothetical protein